MQYTKIVNFGQSGLTTVKYTLYDKEGAVFQTETSAGVTELGLSGVYLAKIDIPDLFDGVLIWSDGNAEPLYAGESFNNFSIDKLSGISEKSDLILSAVAMHRSEVEPIISKLDIGSVREQFEKGLNEVKNTIKTFESSAKQANKEVKEAVKNIKIPEPEKNVILNLEKHLRMVETLYADYKGVLEGVRNLEKSIQGFKTDTSKQIKNFSSSMLKISDMKDERMALSKKLDDHAMTMRTRMSSDFDQMMQKLENEGLSVLSNILKLLMQNAYNNSPQGVNDSAMARKMRLMMGVKR